MVAVLFASFLSAATLNVEKSNGGEGSGRHHADTALPLEFGLGVGPSFSFSGGPVVLRFGLDGELTFLHDPRFDLSIFLPLNLVTFGQTTSNGFFTTNTSVFGFELLPSIRINVPVITPLTVWGDFGLGPVFYSTSTTVTGFGNGTYTGSAAGLGIRLSAGLEYAVTDHLVLRLAPIGLLFNTATTTTYQIGNTTYTANTQTGSQWVLWFGVAYKT